jgi:beta-glucosidase
VDSKNSAVDRPVKQLRGFRRVSVKAGEEKEVEILTPLEKLKWYNPVYREWQLEAMEYPIYVGSSAADEDLVKTTISL